MSEVDDMYKHIGMIFFGFVWKETRHMNHIVWFLTCGPEQVNLCHNPSLWGKQLHDMFKGAFYEVF